MDSVPHAWQPNTHDEGSMEELLAQLEQLQPTVQRRWLKEQEEEYGFDDWEPEGEVWPSLEWGSDGTLDWHCGFRVQADEATVWAFPPAANRNPRKAVEALLKSLRAT